MGPGNNGKGQFGQGNQRGMGSGGPGRGEGGNPPEGSQNQGAFKTEQIPGKYTPGGKILGSIATEGVPVAGEAREALKDEILRAQEEAGRVVREEIPAERRVGVRDYFDQMEQMLEDDAGGSDEGSGSGGGSGGSGEGGGG